MSTAPILKASPQVISQYLSQLSDEELQALGLMPRQQGAPADFGGPVFPNPDNARVYSDEESGIEPTRLPKGVSFQGQNFTGQTPLQTVGTKPEASDDWFEQNAPKTTATATSGDWFEENAPKTTKQPAKQPEQSWLDKELPPDVTGPMVLNPAMPIPLYPNATLSGLQSVGRGIRGAVEGAIDLFSPPKTTAEKAASFVPAGLPVYRVLKGLGTTATDSTQVLDAIKDINASPDPLGTYAKAAQEMAGSGAGQALVAIATEGLIRGVPKGAATVERATQTVRESLPAAVQKTTQAVKMIDPDVVGIASPRAANALRVAQRAAKVASKYANRAAEPASQAEALRTPGAAPPPEPSAGLGQIPVKTPPAEPAPTPPTPTEILNKPMSPAELKQALERPLNESVGAAPLERGKPIYQGPKAFATAKPSAVELPPDFTPVESSVLKGYKYDPATKEFESITNNGQHYIHGEVSPEQAAAFEAADSKGAAWTKEIRNNNPLVAKVLGGKRVPVQTAELVKPTGEVVPKSEAGMQPDVLLDKLNESLQAVQKAKGHSLGTPISLDLDPATGRIGAKYPILDNQGKVVGNITATRQAGQTGGAVHITGIGSGVSDLTNKLGLSFVKKAMKQIMEDAGATEVEGMRVGGALGKNIGKTQVSHKL